jgi:hypothetical protein
MVCILACNLYCIFPVIVTYLMNVRFREIFIVTLEIHN